MAVLLPPEEAFSGEEVNAYVKVRGRTRLSDVGGYGIGWSEGTQRRSITCYIPYPDEREVPGIPGYVTHGNGSTYWEAPPPIQPNHKIDPVDVEVTGPGQSGDWQARFEVSGCRYTVGSGSEESVLALCRLLLEEG